MASTTSLWDTATLLKFSNGAEPSPVTAACPEIRGFDETSSGFVVLDTETDTYKFIPRYIRRVENVKVDLSSAQNQLDVERLVLDGVAGVNVDNYINLQLEGSVEEGS